MRYHKKRRRHVAHYLEDIFSMTTVFLQKPVKFLDCLLALAGGGKHVHCKATHIPGRDTWHHVWRQPLTEAH